MSKVTHFEGVTSGTDLSCGVKSYQLDNMSKLYERWGNVLNGYQLNGDDVDAAKDRGIRYRVLFLDLCTPTPSHDSGSVDAFNQMILLREMGFQVTFIPEDNFLYMKEHTQALQRVGVEVLYSPFVTNIKDHLIEFGPRYDLVFVNRVILMEKVIADIRRYCKKSKVIFHTVDLHFIRMGREADLLKDKNRKQLANEMKVRELALIQKADLATVLSETELEVLLMEGLGNYVRLLPFTRDVPLTNVSFDRREGLVFVGGYQHPPNVDAVKYFVSEIMPILRKKLPGVAFYIVGSKVTEDVMALESFDVNVVGFVENLEGYLDGIRVMVTPLRYGAGIKGKVATALSVGLPVVASVIAAEGMGLVEDEEILISSTPEEFAEKVAKVYHDRELWVKLSLNGGVAAKKYWGSQAGHSNLAKILTELSFDVPSNYSGPPLFRTGRAR
jgi:glycosyltransferase involved in cell wall biosynthesis